MRRDVYESASEAAEAIGVQHTTISRWISRGRLKAERIKRAGKPAYRIRHVDLVEASRGTMFEMPEESQQMLLDTPQDLLKAALSLEVVWPAEHRSSLYTADGIMAGFQRFRALTYTVSLPSILKLLTTQNYEFAEIVFGAEALVRASNAEKVMALQGAIEDEISRGYIAIGGDSDPRTRQLMAWQAEGKAKFYAVAGGVIHSKLYFLEKPGLRRLLVGSANLSERAFSGRQGEVLLAYDNDPWMWDQMLRKYEAVLGLATGLQLKPQIKQAHLTLAEDLPAGREAKSKEAEDSAVTIYVFQETDMPGDPEYVSVRAEEISSSLGEGLRENIKPLPNGAAVLRKGVLQKVNYAAAAKRPDDPSKLHRLERAGGRFIYDGRLVERPTDTDGIERDALLLTQFMDKFREFGAGSDILQRNYYGLWGWLYFTPFMPELARKIHSLGINASKEIKHLAIVYGPSNCGKSKLTDFLLRSMFGKLPSFDSGHFTQSDFKDKSAQVGILPLYYEDVLAGRFTGRGSQVEGIAKYYDQLVQHTAHYPCSIVTANAEVAQFPNEVRNRAFLVYTPKGVASDDDDTRRRLDKDVTPMLNRISQDFYAEYLHRMAVLLADIQDPDSFDYLWESTTLIRTLLIESLRGDEVLPAWAKGVTASDFNGQAWELKHREMAKRLTGKLYTNNFPPASPYWTANATEIILGVESVRDVMRGKELQDHWIKREGTYGKLVTLHRDAVEESIQRTEPKWRLPVPPLQRLADFLHRKKGDRHAAIT